MERKNAGKGGDKKNGGSSKAKATRTKEYFIVMGKRYPIPLTRSFGKTKEHILLESTILFAKKGYAAVSMKDIAKAIGVKPASLYNHYAGKEELWKTVMEHAIGLYLLYFEHLGDELSRAKTFSDLLEIIFSEPKKMTNIFACHAFSLIQMDQFRDGLSGTRFHDVFLRYSAEFLAERFDKCIAGNMVPAFDSKTVATVIMNNVLMAINVKVQACLGRKVPYDPSDMMANLQKLLGRLLIPEQPVPASPPRPASVGAD